jgi:hypothetical protein
MSADAGRVERLRIGQFVRAPFLKLTVDFWGFLPSQAGGYGLKKGFRSVVLRAEKQDGKRRPDMLQAGADGELFIESERRADDGKVIAANRGTAYSLIDFYDKVGGVARLGEEVGSRTQLGDVTTDRKYPADSRIGGGANHLLIH